MDGILNRLTFWGQLGNIKSFENDHYPFLGISIIEAEI